MRPGLWITTAVSVLALNVAPTVARADDADLLARFAASSLSLTSYVGSGTFVANEFSDDPLFAQALSFEPRFGIAEGYSAAAHFGLECELTTPDHPNARRCAAGDLSLSLAGEELVRDPWLNGQVHAALSTYLPTSPESRFNHTIVNIRASAGYSARFLDEHLSAGLNFGVQKYLPSSRVRGPTVADAGDQGSDFPLILARRSAIDDGAVGSGGRLNDNWAFSTSGYVGWQFLPELSATVSLGVYNYVRFSVPDDFLADPSLPLTGRSDVTSGSINIAYTPLEHFGLDFGVSSVQPALTADGKSLRFPFYDFISPSNNFTRWYLAVHLSY